MNDQFKMFQLYPNSVFCFNSSLSMIPEQVIKEQEQYTCEYLTKPYMNTNSSLRLETQLLQIQRFIKILHNNVNGEIVFDSSISSILHKILISEKHSCKIVIDSSYINESIFSSFDTTVWYYSENKKTILSLVSIDTKFVFLSHVCKITGNILDIERTIAIIRIKNQNVKIVIDGSLYVPHRQIDVEKWKVDYYLICFKTFLIPNLCSLFISNNEENKIQSEKNYCEQMGLLGLESYLQIVSNVQTKTKHNLDTAYDIISEHERILLSSFNRHIYRFNNIFEVTEFKNSLYKDKVPIFTLNFKKYNNEYVALFLNELNVFCDSCPDGLRFSLLHYNRINDIEYIFNVLEEFNVEFKSNWSLLHFFTTQNEYDIDKETFVDISAWKYFQYLSKDNYMVEDVFRLYSIIYIPTAKIVGNNRFLKNNHIEHHQCINIIDSEVLHVLLRRFVEFVLSKTKNFSYVTIHQIRYDCNENKIQRLINHDLSATFAFTGILIVSLSNVKCWIINLKKQIRVELYEKDFILMENNNIQLIVTPIDVKIGCVIDIILIKTLF